VAGGTGLVGRYTMAAITDLGHDPVVLSRSVGVDLVARTGLDAALDGVEAVVDVTNVTTMKRQQSVDFFTAVTRNLLAAEQRAGVRQHVALSIVGVDRVPSGYYEGKRQQEALVLSTDGPGAVLRATQFHEFAGQVLTMVKGPLAVVPRMISRPVAAREVGRALAELAVGTANGMQPELAGPEKLRMPDMVRQLLRARGSRRLVVPVRLPGEAGRAMAGGGLLPLSDGPRGRQTYREWLGHPDSAGFRRG